MDHTRLQLGDRVKSVPTDDRNLEYVVIGLRPQNLLHPAQVRVMLAPECAWETMEGGWHVLVLETYYCAPEDLEVI